MEKYSAITFSYAVNKNKEKYYKALEEVPSPLNKGEMTFYLIDMLQLLSSGQKGIVEDLEENLLKLNRIQQYLTREEWKERKIERKLLYILVTINVFIREGAELSIADLMKLSDQSRYHIDKSMAYLIDNQYVELASKNPKTFRVENECLETIIPV